LIQLRKAADKYVINENHGDGSIMVVFCGNLGPELMVLGQVDFFIRKLELVAESFGSNTIGAVGGGINSNSFHGPFLKNMDKPGT
jgi:hypothetical protein